MKVAITVLISALLLPQAFGKELFSARCVPALTKVQFTWRVDESRHGLKIKYSDPKKKWVSKVQGSDAENLRRRVDGLALTQADVDTLHALEVTTPEGEILLHPFDGVTYFVSIMDRDEVALPNPSFDLEHHATLDQTKRIREVLDFLDELTRLAKR